MIEQIGCQSKGINFGWVSNSFVRWCFDSRSQDDVPHHNWNVQVISENSSVINFIYSDQHLLQSTGTGKDRMAKKCTSGATIIGEEDIFANYKHTNFFTPSSIVIIHTTSVSQ